MHENSDWSIMLAEPDNFEAALRRGLGRAVLFLQEQTDATPYREVILEACAHNWAYDRQCEDNRALYMFDVIQATGELEFYAERVREFLKTPEEGHDVYQLFDLNGLLAKNGDREARKVLYETFTRNAINANTAGADALLEVDGITGYLFVIEQWIRYPVSEDDKWEEFSLFEDAQRLCGKKKLQRAISKASATNPDIAAYIARMSEKQTKRQSTERAKDPATYEEIRAAVNGPTTLNRIRFSIMGKNASEEIIVRLAHDLMAETDRDALLRFLHLFYRRRFPLDHTRLRDLARSEDWDLAHAARRALFHICHPTVRVLALDMINSGVRAFEAVNLLVHNYEEGDYRLIENIAAMEHTSDEYHWLGINIRDFIEANPSSEAATVLMMLYEKGYCTMCRCSVIERLLDIGPLPDWMIAECRYDAYDATRESVEDLPRVAPE